MPFHPRLPRILGWGLTPILLALALWLAAWLSPASAPSPGPGDYAVAP
jgi:hypothetical protein